MVSIIYYLVTAFMIVFGIRMIRRAATRPTEAMKEDRLLRAAAGALGGTMAAAGFLLTFLRAFGGFDVLAWTFGDALLFLVSYVAPSFLLALIVLYIRFSSSRD